MITSSPADWHAATKASAIGRISSRRSSILRDELMGGAYPRPCLSANGLGVSLPREIQVLRLQRLDVVAEPLPRALVGRVAAHRHLIADLATEADARPDVDIFL